MADHDRIRLGDDGTLDTVLVCKACGQEARYNYDGGESDTETGPQSYDAFVDWAIEDFDSEHECALNTDRDDESEDN